LGLLKIISESSLASGTRRIEALTGASAFNYLNDKAQILNDLSKDLQCQDSDLFDKVKSLNLSLKNANNVIDNLNELKVEKELDDFLDNSKPEKINEIKFFSGEIKSLEINPQKFGDILRNKMSSFSVALLSIRGNKNMLLCVVTKDVSDFLSAGDIIKAIGSKLGFGGGGSKFFAVTSFKDISLLNKAIEVGNKTLKKIILNNDN